jgi:hypothetical protein
MKYEREKSETYTKFWKKYLKGIEDLGGLSVDMTVILKCTVTITVYGVVSHKASHTLRPLLIYCDSPT